MKLNHLVRKYRYFYDMLDLIKFNTNRIKHRNYYFKKYSEIICTQNGKIIIAIDNNDHVLLYDDYDIARIIENKEFDINEKLQQTLFNRYSINDIIDIYSVEALRTEIRKRVFKDIHKK